jgi:hypothetical protein
MMSNAKWAVGVDRSKFSVKIYGAPPPVFVLVLGTELVVIIATYSIGTSFFLRQNHATLVGTPRSLMGLYVL